MPRTVSPESTKKGKRICRDAPNPKAGFNTGSRITAPTITVASPYFRCFHPLAATYARFHLLFISISIVKSLPTTFSLFRLFFTSKFGFHCEFSQHRLVWQQLLEQHDVWAQELALWKTPTCLSSRHRRRGSTKKSTSRKSHLWSGVLFIDINAFSRLST